MKHVTPDLLKFKRLQRRLNESKRGTVGLLELLWIETQRNAPAGDIGKFTDEEIAIMCDWEGPPDVLVSALLDTGWIDQSATHRLVVHDWSDHVPNYLRAAFKSHGKQFVSNLPSNLLEQPALAPCLATCSSNLLSRGHTEPNLTEPNTGPGSGDPGPEPGAEKIDLTDPMLADYATRTVTPIPSEKLYRSVFSPLKEIHLKSTASLCEWHAKQLSAKQPVAGNTEAHLLLVIAAAIHAMAMPIAKIESSRVAVFIGIVKKQAWTRVMRYLPRACEQLEEHRSVVKEHMEAKQVGVV